MCSLEITFYFKLPKLNCYLLNNVNEMYNHIGRAFCGE